MTKPAERTVSYVVYSPKYAPGNGRFEYAKSLSNAYRICRKMGAGSEVDRHYHFKNKRSTVSRVDELYFVYRP